MEVFLIVLVIVAIIGTLWAGIVTFSCYAVFGLIVDYNTRIDKKSKHIEEYKNFTNTLIPEYVEEINKFKKDELNHLDFDHRLLLFMVDGMSNKLFKIFMLMLIAVMLLIGLIANPSILSFQISTAIVVSACIITIPRLVFITKTLKKTIELIHINE